jgi:hypothetical protein
MFTETALYDLVEKINLTEMRIDIKGKPSIKIAGANDKNGDRLRGNRIYFVLLDECQDINPTVFNEVIRPAMSDTRGSRALFTGTPKGKQNILYALSELRHTDPEWTFFNFPTWDNPTIPKSEIDKARATLAPRVFEQEYGAGFVNFPGQLYSELSSENLVPEGADLPHFDLVVMGVDFGDLHPAFSVVGRDPIEQCWYFIEGWSPNTGLSGDSQPVTRATFDSNLKRLVDKHGVQLIFCDPSRPSEILAIRDLGDKPVYRSAVSAFNGIQSGIGQVHNLIAHKRFKFICGGIKDNTDTVDGITAYDYHQSYHRVKRNDVLTDEPADGDCTHICDSTRYALAVKGK